MRLAAIAAAVAVAAGAAGAAPGRAPVLAFTADHLTLTWFDPATLRQVSRRTAPMAYHTCAPALSPDGARLVSSLCGDTGTLELRVVDVRRMRAVADIALPVAGYAERISWLGGDRIVVVVNRNVGNAEAYVVDPNARRIVRSIPLPGQATGVAALADAVAVLLIPIGRFGPAQVAVVDANATLRRTSIASISTGYVVKQGAREASVRQRGAGFAVDTATGTAYVVAPDLLVAQVDLATLRVEYHRPVTRTLQKSIRGPYRSAAWLGDGLLAVSGADYVPAGTSFSTKPFGLRLVDTRDWSSRTADATVAWLRFSQGTIVAGPDVVGRASVAYDTTGRELWRVAIPRDAWLDVAGDYAYLCDDNFLRRVLDVRTGATVTSLGATSARRCADFVTR